MTSTPRELPGDVAVINVGLDVFAEAVAAQGRPVVKVDWRIPGGGDEDVVAALRRLYGPLGGRVDAANAEVLRRLDESVPELVAVERAGDVVPGLEEGMLLHCGPAISYADACDPLQRSMRAAAVAEGYASTVGDAHQRLAAGEIRLEPATAHRTVVPMVSAIGPTEPVFVVENRPGGNRAFAPLNQGPGETAWYGRDTDAAVERLELLRNVAGPLLHEVVGRHGPFDVFGLAAQGVQMGDDVHIRNQASSNLLLRTLLPELMALDDPRREALALFLSANYLFFLNLAMAAARATADWAATVEDSSIVVSMCRNGTSYEVRLTGSLGGHLAPAPAVGQGLYYAGYGPEDSAPDVGDSAVLELVGLGGAAAGGSPSVAAFVGGTMADARRTTEEVDRICAGRSTRFRLAVLDSRGTPIGVDARRVVELGATPKVTTGILHASSGIGQVGAGVAAAPLACFVEALLDLDRRLRA